MDRYGPRQNLYDGSAQYDRNTRFHSPAGTSRQPKYVAGPPMHPPLRRDSRHASEHVTMQPPFEQRRMRQASQSVDYGSRQPRSIMADGNYWDSLRQQGYVLRGSVSAPSFTHQAPPLAIAPSSVSYASTSYRSSYNHQPIPSQRQSAASNFQVHPHLRTSSHPQSTPKSSQPTNAFMKPVHPTHKEGTQSTVQHVRRPALQSRPSATTIRTVSRGVQLKPEHIFTYARPSKASYYEPEPTYASQSTRPPVPRRVSAYCAPDSLAQQWDTKSAYPPSIKSLPSRPQTPSQSTRVSHQWDNRSAYAPSTRSTSSRPQTPCQIINVQPEYPPSPISPSSPQHPSYNHDSLHSEPWPLATSQNCKRSGTLHRQETTNSLYSQQTYHESYVSAMEKEQHERSRRPSQPPSLPPLDRSTTEMTLGTAQRLWHELEQQLLGEDLPTPRAEQMQPLVQTSPNVTRAGESQYQGSEYDFTDSPTPTQPLRPRLNRRKSSHYRYKGHERHGETLLHRARDAVEPTPPPPAAGTTGRNTKPSKSSVRPTASAASRKQVSNLRTALRRKTPGNEMLEVEAMRELVRQSAPSEVDRDEVRLDSDDERDGRGSEAEERQESSEEDSSDGMTFAAESQDEGEGYETEQEGVEEAEPPHEVPNTESRTSLSEDKAVAAPPRIARAVRTVTRIPAPVSRTFAGKLYAYRATISKE